MRIFGPFVLLLTEINIVTQQLNDGIRMLQMQVHNNNGVIQLCHTSCVSWINFLSNRNLISLCRHYTTAERWQITSL